jgi:hypothetical protein
LLLCPALAEAGERPALQFENGWLQSSHAIVMRLQQPEGFRPVEPVRHQSEFNGLPFDVSVAAYVAQDRFIMVHAETLTDGSGAIDYGTLPSETLSGITFGVRGQCAELSPEVIESEHDLKFLAEGGLEVLPAGYLRQYLLISPDRNSEYIVSVGQVVDSCDTTEDPEWRARFQAWTGDAVRLEAVDSH